MASEPIQGLGVYDAVASVMEELGIGGIAKKRTNTQGAGFKFRGIDDILNALGPTMPKHGLTVFPRMLERTSVERQSKAGGVLFYVTVKASFKFVSKADGSSETAEVFGEAMDSSDKATSKAMSIAWKNAAILTFQIPVEGENNDADAVTHQIKPEKKAVEPPFPSGPCRNASDLKATWRSFWSEVESCEDIEQLEALLAVQGNRDLMKQLKLALPEWWNGGKAAGTSYEGAGERLAKLQTELTQKYNERRPLNVTDAG